jgi:hypothetical protein
MGKYEGAAAYMCVHINKTIELYYVNLPLPLSIIIYIIIQWQEL